MLYPALPPSKRLIAAKVAGAVARLAVGTGSGLRTDQKLEALWVVTQDPQILGHELGPYLAEPHPNQGTAAAIELLRAAGADETVAQENAAWQRYRMDRERGGPRT